MINALKGHTVSIMFLYFLKLTNVCKSTFDDDEIELNVIISLNMFHRPLNRGIRAYKLVFREIRKSLSLSISLAPGFAGAPGSRRDIVLRVIYSCDEGLVEECTRTLEQSQ